MYNCNTCKYAKFKYSKNWKVQYVYCKRIKDILTRKYYKRLKYCNFYDKLGG